MRFKRWSNSVSILSAFDYLFAKFVPNPFVTKRYICRWNIMPHHSYGVAVMFPQISGSVCTGWNSFIEHKGPRDSYNIKGWPTSVLPGNSISEILIPFHLSNANILMFVMWEDHVLYLWFVWRQLLSDCQTKSFYFINTSVFAYH